MNSKNKFLILSIIVIFIAILGFSYANNQDNTINEPVNNTNNSSWGCCSIILQEDGSNATFAYRRDANLSADISIEKMNWQITFGFLTWSNFQVMIWKHFVRSI